MIEALDIRVRGIVQGVGFRPFVYRLARRHIISGWVLNDLDGVFIHAEGESQLLDEFITELHMDPPAAARITEVELKEVPLQDCEGFEIRESKADDADERTLVSADLATCDDCLKELFDPSDRRFRYPFINCTNCGPRFTIIDSLPYDRPATSMAPFKMCATCANEYADPGDRRFHAQPDACFECGPHLSFVRTDEQGPEIWGMTREQSDDIISKAVSMLIEGKILAVKGLGGFHLVCDAANAEALAVLRARKHRGGQAFAVMVSDIGTACEMCEVSETEAGVMRSSARPIVLVRKKVDAHFVEGLADGLPELGVMMPATPLQHLIIHDFRERSGRDMLVMTSGNLHDEPIVVDDAVAVSKLGAIADAVLGNDRPILSRYDDSVVRVLTLGDVDAQGRPNEALQFIRRARGYAPAPIELARVAPAGGAAAEKAGQDCVFAAGSEQKNTFAYVVEGRAYVSQHIGDMEDADVFDAWVDARGRFKKLFAVEDKILACDAHPEYLASKWARKTASDNGNPLVEVQHHHAHIASVLAEHGLYGPCCGIAFDGTGFGADGSIWGGEVLLANQVDYERFANLVYMPMPGGAAAVKHPLRMAYGLLWSCDLLEHPGAARMLEELGGQEAEVCERMIETGLNTPMTSSMGRLFDAVSAILGVCTQPTYEGEAAILLDAAQQRCAEEVVDAAGYAFEIIKNTALESSTAHDTSVVVVDPEPVVRAVLNDIADGVRADVIARRFHEAVVELVVQVAELVRAVYGIELVALSGGCFMNRFLVEQSVRRLGQRGFTVALNASLPPNDGCVSYGQAAVAVASR